MTTSGLEVFKIKPITKGASTNPVFHPGDFDIDVWQVEEDKPAPLERVLAACDQLKQAIQDLASIKTG